MSARQNTHAHTRARAPLGPNGERTRLPVARTRSANRLSLSLCRQNSPRSRRRRSSGNNMAAADSLVSQSVARSLCHYALASLSFLFFPPPPSSLPQPAAEPLSSPRSLSDPLPTPPRPTMKTRFASPSASLRKKHPNRSPRRRSLTSGGVRFRSSRWIRFFMSMAGGRRRVVRGKEKARGGPGEGVSGPVERGAEGANG